MNIRPFSAEDISRFFDQLQNECKRLGINAEMLLVGGAAIAVTLDTRRTTQDIDALFEPKKEFYRVIEKVANDNNLPQDWINDAAKGFMPTNDPEAKLVYKGANLKVLVPSDQYLLAMKLRAARFEVDQEDAVALAAKLGITKVEEATEILTAHYPERILEAKSKFFIEGVIEKVQEILSDNKHSQRITLKLDPITPENLSKSPKRNF